jgi:hypothetical protein
MKKLLIVGTVLSTAISAFADLGYTRAQIAAKYGQPETVHNSAALVNPFWIGYEGKNAGVGVHYNQKGIVTVVEYSHDHTDRPSGFSDDEFRALLKDNGIKDKDLSKWSLKDFPFRPYALFSLGGYPDYYDYFVEFDWDSRNTYPWGYDSGESQRNAPVVFIRIWTAESLAELATWNKAKLKPRSN